MSSHPIRFIASSLLLLAVACSDAPAGSSPPGEWRIDEAAYPDATITTDGDQESGQIWAAHTKQLRAARIAAVQADAPASYDFIPGHDEVEARNAAQRLSMAADDGTLVISPDSVQPRWSMALRWTGFGRGSALVQVAPPHGQQLAGNRLGLWRGSSEEWYINGSLGIEQGFVIADAPADDSDAALSVAVEVTGELQPTLAPDGQSVGLRDTSGVTRLRYSDLFATDANGRSLDAHMEVAGSTIVLRIEDQGADYPITIDPLLWVEAKKLAPTSPEDQSFFGYVVAVSGDIALISHHKQSLPATDNGAVHVFERDLGGAGNWGERKRLTASDVTHFDFFGSSVAISGDTAIFGSRGEDGAGVDRGAAYVFERHLGGADNWGERKKLVANPATNWAELGEAVAISGDTAIVGTQWENGDRGAAYVFDRDLGGANNWGQRARLLANNGNDDANFGVSVAISGDTAIVSAYLEDGLGTSRGAVYVFERDLGGTDNWGERKKILPSVLQDNARFGRWVALEGDRLVVGAYQEDGVGNDSGAAYVFERDHGGTDNWGERKRLVASNGEAGAWFGERVALEGDRVVVGATGQDGLGSNRGAAYVFERNLGGADNWGERQWLSVFDAQDEDRLGSVAISGDAIVVGAYTQSAGGTERGGAYVFRGLLGDGDSCAFDSECLHGHCVDGVCCHTACGGGATDCQACNVSGSEGICSPVGGTLCRSGSGDACDPDEVCDGANLECPADIVMPDSHVCRDGSGDSCDPAETCTGVPGSSCPADYVESDGAACQVGGTDGSCVDGTCELQAQGGGGQGGGGDGGTDQGAGTPSPPTSPPTESVGGCDCRAAAGNRPSPPWLVAFGLGLAAARTRRRRMRLAKW